MLDLAHRRCTLTMAVWSPSLSKQDALCNWKQTEHTSVRFIIWSVFECDKLSWTFYRWSRWLACNKYSIIPEAMFAQHPQFFLICLVGKESLDLSTKRPQKLSARSVCTGSTCGIWHNNKTYWAMECAIINRTYPFNFIWCNNIPIFNKVNLDVKNKDNTWTFKLQWMSQCWYF